MQVNASSLETLFVRMNEAVLNHPEFVSETRIGRAHEMIDITGRAESTLDFQFTDERINRIKYDYAEKFWEFMISGGTDAQEAFKEFPNVAKFMAKPKSDSLPENFNTFYGPRIVAQYDSIVAELKRSPTTRRATMLILSAADLQLLDKDETLEFPCTISMNFQIRGGKLIMSTFMRSQNIAIVFQLDIYLQIKLLHKIAADIGMKPEDTKYHVHMANGHVFERDFEYIKGFLA
jgi:hypothetical protein